MSFYFLNTPMLWYPTKNQTNYLFHPELKIKYQTLVGSFLYIMNKIQPDLAYIVSQVKQYTAIPNMVALEAIHHIFRYTNSI